MASNQKYRFYFHHVPKTGGMFMRKILSQTFDETIICRYHRTPHESRRSGHYTKNNEYYTFAIVRNPYERFVSAWLYLKNSRLCDIDQRDRERWIDGKTFPEFCFSLADGVVDSQCHFRKQSYYLPDACKDPETIKHIFYSVKDAVGAISAHTGKSVSNAVLEQRVNASKAAEPVKMTKELADIIYQHYSEDFERFGYAKDSWRDMKRNVVF